MVRPAQDACILPMRQRDSFEQDLDRAGLFPPEFLVLAIDVVHDLADRDEGGLPEPDPSSSVSNVQRSPSWVNSPSNMSNRISPLAGRYRVGETNRNRALGSMNRTISQALAIRSTNTLFRVTQVALRIRGTGARDRTGLARGRSRMPAGLRLRCRLHDLLLLGGSVRIPGGDAVETVPEGIELAWRRGGAQSPGGAAERPVTELPMGAEPGARAHHPGPPRRIALIRFASPPRRGFPGGAIRDLPALRRSQGSRRPNS